MAQPKIVYHLSGLIYSTLTLLQERLNGNGIETSIDAELRIHCPADRLGDMQRICLEIARERAVPNRSFAVNSICA
ncbi:MAG TPA: hypothetical protein V6C81_19410 [Planktothrix sp.]|jgi:hypothetical protein